ncbi:peptidase family M49-domain-containing protein [Lipomyces arxii]|uniref:peptidase family M49-domain-containing protein n=1 Tax=Lipomyces arxii TaxID=56418 RepID=UPI0034CEB3A3
MAFNFFADSNAPISALSAKPHFTALSLFEQLYAHHYSKAAHYGTRVVLRQVSPESESIFDFVLDLYKLLAASGPVRDVMTSVPYSLSSDDATHWLEYCSQFLSNLGNYKSFGDVKFIPRIASSTLKSLVDATKDDALIEAYSHLENVIYDTEPAQTLLGYPEGGHVTGYYSGLTITQSEIEKIHDAIGGIYLPENTRVEKRSDIEFVVHVAAGTAPTKPDGDKTEYTVEGLGTVTIAFDDHAREMALIANEMELAGKYAANETQKSMIDEYVRSFRTGSMHAHKESQKYWVKDIGPKVETNIGFIETYRDPAGIRGEWEGLIAMVNAERTKTFGALVDSAKTYISKLPWPTAFEKDVFTPPDFTSLEVMTFAGSGIPAGINIPNYDDVRQTIGFKNVSLGNVLSARSANERTPFLRDQDLELYDKLRGPAFEVQVGIHELLGHGSGKLLSETSDGVFNFDKSTPIKSPIDGTDITTYYKPGQTWGSVFGTTAGSYEECRAECVAMYLCTDKSLLKIFGHEGQEADDVVFIAYLQMARAGLVGLEYWDPATGKWGQPHMQARFSILKQFLEYGDKSFVKLVEDADGEVQIVLDRFKINSHGQAAIGEYLQKLHVYKSSGDVVRGKALYAASTSVTPELAKYRDAVLKNKLPRRQFVQCNTISTESDVEYKEYDETPEGMIESFLERDV